MTEKNTIIISNCVINVNPPANENPDYLKKWVVHKGEAKHVAEKMAAIGYTGRALRMAKCADVIEYTYCHDCDKYTVARANLCRDRFCPICSWRLSLQRYISMSKIIERLPKSSAGYSLITLTVKNCLPDRLSFTLDTMYNAWNRLRQRKTIKNAIGYAKSIEITFNNRTLQFHPHYHILIAWGDYNGKEDIINEWLKSCAQSGLTASYKAQDAQDIHDKGHEGNSMAAAICETYKYAVKGNDLDLMPLMWFKKIAQELAGKRLVAFGGEIKRIAAELKINMEIVDSGEINVCHRCGSMDVDRLIYHWAFDGYKLWR